PITKARTDSISVIQRWSQIEPSENQRTIRHATFSGVAKKNDGRIGSSKIGTAVRRCQSAIATAATRSWSERSLPRYATKLLWWPVEMPSNSGRAAISVHSRASPPARGQARESSWVPASAGTNGEHASVRLHEQADNAGRALGARR